MMNGKSRILLNIIIFVVVGSFGIYLSRGYLAKNIPWLDSFFGNQSKGNRVTYYQWTAPSGEMVISRDKPKEGVSFISFEGAENLISNENNVDQDLISQGNAFRTQAATQTKKTATSRSTKNVPSSSIYPFSAISKVKRCTKLSSQISDARNHQKDTTTLKKQYAKEC